ncbi:MAG: hypothetical protein U0228_30245 [Myxococcaceae bacterium]
MARRLFLLFLVTASSLAAAQGFELERVVLNPGARETLFAQTGDALDPMKLRVQLLGHYEHRPLVYTVDSQEVGAAIEGRWTTHLVAAFGIHRFVEASLQVPVVLYQGGEDLTLYGLNAVPAAAMGAPWLSVRSGLLRQSMDQPLDLAVSLSLSLPFGSAQAFTRDPGAGLAFVPRVGVGRTLGPLRFGGELGVLVRGAQVLSPATAMVKDEVGSQFSAALAISSVGLPVHLELCGRVIAPFTATGVSGEVLAAVRAKLFEQFEVSLAGGPGFGQAPGTPAFRVLLGFAWTPDFAAPAAPSAPAPEAK